MSTDAAVAEGRPGAGQVLAAEMGAAAAGRAKRRDLKPLASLRPFVGAHVGDAIAAGVFLVLSTAATLGLTLA
ncbi:MAG: ABC transporter, partial [Caulobacteraceae bacterium]